MHLSERAMLYVVFTFGEMIIALAAYFTGDGGLHWNTIYFSAMGFLIVVGLFLSYEIVYDHLVDREGDFDGMLYLGIHIFIIFAMNNITTSLEFMREEEIALLPKILFIVISIVAYYLFMFALKGHLKKFDQPNKRYYIRLTVLTGAFILLMVLLRSNMYVNIFLSVVYVYSIYMVLRQAKTHVVDEE